MNIYDIALLANVSVSTVSKILNNKDGDISETTKQRVLQVIKEYQYTPYANRKGIVPLSNIIAVVIEKPFAGDVPLQKFEQKISQNGYSTLVCYVDEDLSNLNRCVSVLDSKRVEGMIVCTYSRSFCESMQKAIDKKIPIVFFAAAPTPTYPSVYCDYSKTGYFATKYLIEHGHTKIGCLLYSGEKGLYEQAKEGYLKALFESSILKEDQNVFLGANLLEIQKIGVRKLLDRNVTAVYCQNSVIANIVYSMAANSSLRIPEDISVVSGQLIGNAESFIPPLTTARIPYQAMIDASVDALVKGIERKKFLPPRGKEIMPEIQEGDSAAFPAGMGKKIIVVGNIMMDILINTEEPPASDKIVTADNVISVPGGKATDQAIGVGKLGGFAYILGRMGDDSEGKSIINQLVELSVKTDGIMLDTSSSTGRAYITSFTNRDSVIITYPGANRFFDSKQIKQFSHLFADCGICLLTTEISADAVESTIKFCNKYHVEVFLKPSDIKNFNINLLDKIDYFIPNKKELDQLLPFNSTVEEKAQYIFNHGVKNVIVTLADKGCYLKNEKYSFHFPAADFHAVDTTGAANAFISALAISLGTGNDLIYAICFATYAAGISVTQKGVQSSFPDRETLNLYQDDIRNLCNTIQGTLAK